LQESRIFHDSKAVNASPRQCCTVITKLLHLISQGEQLNSAESTEVFFGVTKLFQSKDASLRRMVYLFIKEVAESCNPDDVIIVTSSLTKDMNHEEVRLFPCCSFGRVLTTFTSNFFLQKHDH